MATPSAADVAEAMAMTFEREDATGALWCPTSDAAALRRWVTDRSRQLGGGLRRVVRFARLARLADGRDYVRFVYIRVPALRTRHFQQALQAAARDGRLSPAVAEVGATGVRLKEPALQVQGAAFEIDYVQMPRLAALLDVLHNALGYATVADELAPLLGSAAPAVSADDIARRLQARLNAWLSERLGSRDHLRQGQIIRAFLAGRGRVVPEAVDDEAIMSFWTAQAAAAGEGDGFRLYRSAARALLRYRKALHDALAEAQLDRPLALGDDPDFAQIDLERIEPAELAVGAWQSPLLMLAAPPANAVKWLNRTERLQLANYLGGPHPEDDPEEPESEADDSPDTGLFGGERFDLAFVRTLLRADVFGTAQSSIVGRLRKRVAAPDAVAQALAPIGEGAYAACAADYAAVRDQLRREALAALVMLMDAGAAEAVILLRHFGGQDAVDAVMTASRNVTALRAAAPQCPVAPHDDGSIDPIMADEVVARIATTLAAAALHPDALLPEGTRALVEQGRAAARRVNRLGFRREDRGDVNMLRSLRSAVGAVVDVLAELDRLEAALSPNERRAEAHADRTLFAAAFADMYGAGADSV